MSFARLLAGCGLALAALLGSGCATPVRPDAQAQAGAHWTGRMALQVEGRDAQSFSAGFELQGSALAGELKLYTPLGSTLAVLSWAPGAATLRSNGQARQFDSVEALAAEATGTAIPVGALFDWLGGVGTAAAGWDADLSQLAQGRLRARRTEPAPAADLRVAFDR